jgi:SAM-dependent methyltransferase
MGDVGGMVTGDDRLREWLLALETRHLADLSFPEVSRALRALSSTYVERRARLREGAALSGAGKRAAFAMFYGPLHLLLTRHIAQALPARMRSSSLVVDLGCGTGASGAGWALGCESPPEISGVDRHPWAVEEAKVTYRAFGLRARVRVEDLARTILPPNSLVLAAFAVNELTDALREPLLQKLLAHKTRGGSVVVLEPLAGGVAPWWPAWRHAFELNGGRADEWRARLPLPPIVAKLDRAAGLNHRELTGRTLTI